VKFCPRLFKKDPENSFNYFDLEYKMIFALATEDSILIYSTQSLTPIFIVGNIHYALINDLSWL